MSLEMLGLLVVRDTLEGVSKETNDWILNHWFYCKKCRACSINSHLQKELKRNSFKTENSHVKLWRLSFVDDLPNLSKNL